MRTLNASPCALPRSEHAEGPCWDGRRQELVWVDISGGKVHRAATGPVGRQLEHVTSYGIGQPVGAAVPTSLEDGGWLLATELGFSYLGPGGTVRTLAEPEAPSSRGIRMNDGKCDPNGHFWAGSMAYDERPGAARLYLLDTELRLRIQLENVTISNGMAWSRDGRTMYYADTPTQRIDRLTLDDDASIRSREIAFTIDPSLGSPDGMTIDQEGCLWIALWGGRAVVRYAPDGELLARVEVEAEQVSSCAFGGPDLRTLFITTSQQDFTDEDRKAQPEAGLVHSVELDVGGFEADRFRGELREGRALSVEG